MKKKKKTIASTSCSRTHTVKRCDSTTPRDGNRYASLVTCGRSLYNITKRTPSRASSQCTYAACPSIIGEVHRCGQVRPALRADRAPRKRPAVVGTTRGDWTARSLAVGCSGRQCPQYARVLPTRTIHPVQLDANAPPAVCHSR